MTDYEEFELWLEELETEFVNQELREIFSEGIGHDKFFEVDAESKTD